jgi:hypothetical protein
MAYFAFNSGGFFAQSTSYVAILLCIILLVRMLGGLRPLEGLSWSAAAALLALSLYALVALLSEHWSHAPGVAIVEFNRALLYLLALFLFSSVARSRWRLVWTLRLLAIAIVIVCGCALVTRLLPNVWPTAPSISNSRLSFPVTYWNVLGLLAAFGVVLCVHFTSDENEPARSRVAGAAAVPIPAVTLYFTFSRGSIGVCLIAVVVYALVARPRGLVSAMIAVVPATAIAVKVAYDATLLATVNPTTARASAQGHHVAAVVAACVVGAGLIRLLALRLDRELVRIRLPARNRRRRSRIIAWSTLAVVVILAGIALSGTISHDYHRFFNPPQGGTDLRARLTDPSSDGRVELWRIALHQFDRTPVLGAGAGTYHDTFLERRSDAQFVLHAHSLYLQNLDELGVIGLGLLLVALLTVLVRTALRARGLDRAVYAAVFALMLAWAIEAGVDWDWEMPVVTILFFALGGLVLAREAEPASAPEPAREPGSGSVWAGGIPSSVTRTVLGLGCVLLAVAPAYLWLAERKLTDTTDAFSSGNCSATMTAARSSISTLGIEPEAYAAMGYCDQRRGQPVLAISAMKEAASLDPQNWNFAYGLALMQAADGLNARQAAHRALTLDPQEPEVQAMWQAVTSGTPARTQRYAQSAAQSVTDL